MGKKYYLVEVDGSSDVDEAAAFWVYGMPLLVLIPFLLWIYALVKERDEPGECTRVLVFSIIQMVIHLSTAIGLFFGVSHVSAALSFMLFLWGALIFVYHMVVTYANDAVKDFVDASYIDVAVFLCTLAIVPAGIIEYIGALGGSNGVFIFQWIIVAIIILHVMAMFIGQYLNVELEDKLTDSKLVHIGLTCIYLLPAVPFLVMSLVYAIDPLIMLHFW